MYALASVRQSFVAGLDGVSWSRQERGGATQRGGRSGNGGGEAAECAREGRHNDGDGQDQGGDVVIDGLVEEFQGQRKHDRAGAGEQEVRWRADSPCAAG